MRIWALLPILGLLGCPGEPPKPPTGPPRAGLVINEVMAGNDTAVRDPDSPECPEFDDWIELVNDSLRETSLAGVALHDTDRSFALPPVNLAPGEHVVAEGAQGELVDAEVGGLVRLDVGPADGVC